MDRNKGYGISYSMIGVGVLHANIEQQQHLLVDLLSFPRIA